MTMLETRKAQAQLAIRIWKELLQQVGADEAGRILRRAIAADARAAGMAFAKQTQSRPSLEHFATVLTRWQEGNALVIENIQLVPQRCPSRSSAAPMPKPMWKWTYLPNLAPFCPVPATNPLPTVTAENCAWNARGPLLKMPIAADSFFTGMNDEQFPPHIVYY